MSELVLLHLTCSTERTFRGKKTLFVIMLIFLSYQNDRKKTWKDGFLNVEAWQFQTHPEIYSPHLDMSPRGTFGLIAPVLTSSTTAYFVLSKLVLIGRSFKHRYYDSKSGFNQKKIVIFKNDRISVKNDLQWFYGIWKDLEQRSESM